MPATTVDVDELVSSNLALVGHLAREAASRLPRHLDSDDLIGAGSLALVQAAQAFEPEQGVPFARFASVRVRGAMIDQMRSRDWATRSVRSRARTIATVTETLTRTLNRRPTESELAQASGLSVAEIRDVLQGTERATLLSLDPLNQDEEGLGVSLPDSAPRPDEALIAAERMGYLRDALAELPERTRKVVAGYYLDNRPLTEIAEELGVTQSRASQLRSEGLELLREALSTLYIGTLPEQSQDSPAGVKQRRKNAYVDAVASRSSTTGRADVRAYLAGNPLDPSVLQRASGAGAQMG